MFLMKFYNFMTDDEKLFQSLLLVDNVSYEVENINISTQSKFQSLLLVDNVSYKIMAFKPKRRLESFNPYFSWTMFLIGKTIRYILW